jgi:hypothetical protein
MSVKIVHYYSKYVTLRIYICQHQRRTSVQQFNPFTIQIVTSQVLK